MSAEQPSTSTVDTEEYGSVTTVDVGRTPHSVAVSHDGTRVYVTHFLTGEVSVVDTASSSVVARFELSPGLYGIAVSADDEFLYVANQDTTFVDRLAAADGERGASAGIGVSPYGLATGRSRVTFAACALANEIRVLDGLVKTIARLTDVDFPVTVAAGPDGARLYVSDYFSSTVSVLDITGLDEVIASADNSRKAVVEAKIAVAANPYGLAVNADGSRLYIAHFGSGDLVSVVDTASREVVGELHAGNGLVRGIAIAPDDSRLYVTNYFADSISVIPL